ncbi:hypothetical protein GA0061083_0515 [Pseudarthrobacter enclensis]|uniref:ATP-binding protein n=1 Tax=Pseudarthrobacter enclensis TaxID=993070 RepID=UPI000815F640|nr:ATP-binding protein [Pseudarthrobacter enclensis]SCB75242.1 hypothetical protein GA0061083_0515 [Pseudarthrobacter enclensis]
MTSTGVARQPDGLCGLTGGEDMLALDILGVQFTVRWGDGVTAAQRDGMRLAWSRCAGLQEPVPSLPREDLASGFTAAVAFRTPTDDGGVFTLRATSFEELAEGLTSRLTLTAILANAGSLTMLHACGVADPETGAVVALVAKSGTGKTTASSVLARRYGYVTDETVAIRPDGSVLPYPKPLSIKQAPGLPKQQVGPDALGLLEAPAQLQLRSIVLLDRVESAEPVVPVLSKVPLADAVLALIPDSSSQAALAQPLQSLCRLIDATGGVWQVTYTEATDLPAALEPLFHATLVPKPEWRPVAQENAPNGGIPEGTVRRASCTDAVTIGDDLLLVLEGAVVRLGGIGPVLWAAAGKPASLVELTQAVRDVHGAPQGHEAAVVRAVEQLTAAGILQRSGNRKLWKEPPNEHCSRARAGADRP